MSTLLVKGWPINPLAVFDTVSKMDVKPQTAEYSPDNQGPDPDYEVQLRNFEDVLVARYFFYNCPIAITPKGGKVVYPITHMAGGTITIIELNSKLPTVVEEDSTE